MSIRSTTLFLLLSISIITPARLSAQISPALATTLQTKLDDLAAMNQLKGISAAVYIPHQGMWRGVTGVSYAAKKIDTTMLFSIGSITKAFVATEILKLVEENKLSLSDTVGQFMPPHQYINPSITIKQLLGHQAGLGDVTNQAMSDATFADLYRRWDAQEVLDLFLTAPAMQPGKGFRYSNAGYVILGIIAEKIEQDSLHKILRNRFLSPLGLKDTYMHMYDPFTYKIPHNWATANLNPAQAQDASGYPHPALWTTTEAAGGLFSSPVDLAKFGYALYTGQVLDTASMREMTTFKPTGGSYFNGYGLGCMRFPNTGKMCYGHAGNYFGYAASMFFHPQDSICMGLLVNQDCISPNTAGALMNTLLQKLATSIVDAVNEDKKFMVYPNPATDKVYIRTSYSDSFISTLYDISGRKVLTTKNADALDISELENGMYTLSIETIEGARFEKKLIVNR